MAKKNEKEVTQTNQNNGIHLIFYSSVDRPKKKDAKEVFKHAAMVLAKWEADEGGHIPVVFGVNCEFNSINAKGEHVRNVDLIRSTVLKYLRMIADGDKEQVKRISFIGHGHKQGFQFGENTRTLAKGGNEFIAELKLFDNLEHINLYCCSCAEGGSNFAEKLLACMQDSHPKLMLYAHWNEGHAVLNPCVDYMGPFRPRYFANQIVVRRSLSKEVQLNDTKKAFKEFESYVKDKEYPGWAKAPYLFSKNPEYVPIEVASLCNVEAMDITKN